MAQTINHPPIQNEIKLGTTINRKPSARKLLRSDKTGNVRNSFQHNQITQADKYAIKTLSNNHDITIKPFDKGRGIAILNTTDYIVESHRILSCNTNYYTKLL